MKGLSVDDARVTESSMKEICIGLYEIPGNNVSLVLSEEDSQEHGEKRPKTTSVDLLEARAEALLLRKWRAIFDLTTAALRVHVLGSRNGYWKKLVQLMKYLRNVPEDVVKLGIGDINFSHRFVGVSFEVHPDFESQTGASMSQGKGAIIFISRKQRFNTRSSTESELVGVDDAINVRYCSITDQIEKGNVKIEYCNTDEMFGDYTTKPIRGSKFKEFKSFIGESKPA